MKRLWLGGMLVALSGMVFADDYAQSWGPAVGATAPAIEAQDQDGTTRDLASLCGENGVSAAAQPLGRLVTLLQGPVGSTGKLAEQVRRPRRERRGDDL